MVLKREGSISWQNCIFLVLRETGYYWEPMEPSQEGVHIFTSGSFVLVLSSGGNRCEVGCRAKAKPEMEASCLHFSLGVE